MKLGQYKHTTVEKKRYTISYAEWLESGEILDSVTYAISPTTTTPLLIEGSAIAVDGLGVSLFISGGENEEEYTISVLAQTDAGQRKNDYLSIVMDNYDV